MGDSWEDDWDSDSFQVKLPGGGDADGLTAGQAALAAAVYDPSKFADEDESGAEPTGRQTQAPASRPKNEAKKKIGAGKEHIGMDDVPLDDPEAERLRQQRRVEEADLRAAQELFAGTGIKSELDGFVPKSKGDFERWGEIVAKEHVLLWHGQPGAHYKALCKVLMRQMIDKMTLVEVKDMEKELVEVRKLKEKEEAERKAAGTKKGGKKFANKINLGSTAGLDDDRYDDAGAGDDFDFM
ncbi:unnamed protein product [Pedinophyceae sp. YPF-701]|nr:unnamed protein product [Pedinophyceae sp. YPF-701]